MAVGAVGALLGIVVVGLAIPGLISVLTDSGLTGGGKLLWALLVLYLPILGGVAWFVMGRKGQFNSLVGITKVGRHEAAGYGTHAKEPFAIDLEDTPSGMGATSG